MITAFTFESLFCGAGGDITGMIDAGGELVAAANHWDRAMETVDANYGHTGAELLCVDINHYDMRRLPKAQVLWASVICTEVSPAGGNRVVRGQQAMALEEEGHVPAAAYERTRACALDVLRATEVHRYDAVVVENVVEFARNWELFDWWIEGMCRLRPGYEVQILCADSAHIAGESNDPAPQWRGRIYVVFTRKGIAKPELSLRPTSYCPACESLVEGVQWWKRPDRPRIGKYGPQGQYLYRCSRPGCSEIVEPLVLPASVAIDWSNLGQRIGDRSKPLAPSTMARIAWGYETFGAPTVATVAGNTFERASHRVWPAEGAPLNTRVATGEDALTCPPFMVKNYGSIDEARYRPAAIGDPLGSITASGGNAGLAIPQPWITMLRNHTRATGTAGEPMATIATEDGHHWLTIPEPWITMLRGPANRPTGTRGEPLTTLSTGNNHYLTTPPGSFVVKNFGGNAQPEHLCFAADGSPLGTVTTKDHHALVIPYRRGKAKTTASPLHTLGTVESAGLATLEERIADCRYRMLTPREHLRGQRFRDGFICKGNNGEQTMQAGNAVSVNAAHHIGRALAEVLA